MISSQTIVIFVISSIVSAIWYYWTQVRSKVPGESRTTLYLFTKRNQVYRVEAENSGGLIFPDKTGSPGFVEEQTASITRRSGRVWGHSNSKSATDAKRPRERVLIGRENDPTPLTISLGPAGQYQGDQIDNKDFKALSNLNQREAAANARIEGSFEDSIANKLLIATIISISGAVLAWGGVFALIWINGEPAV